MLTAARAVLRRPSRAFARAPDPTPLRCLTTAARAVHVPRGLEGLAHSQPRPEQTKVHQCRYPICKRSKLVEMIEI